MIVYVEFTCKHCHAQVMLNPAEIADRKVTPRCPYCTSPKLRSNGSALDVDEEAKTVRVVNVQTRRSEVTG